MDFLERISMGADQAAQFLSALQSQDWSVIVVVLLFVDVAFLMLRVLIRARGGNIYGGDR